MLEAIQMVSLMVAATAALFITAMETKQQHDQTGPMLLLIIVFGCGTTVCLEATLLILWGPS